MQQRREREAPTIAVILAGGDGMRMGGAVKPLLSVDGISIIDRITAALHGLVDECVVSTRAHVSWTSLRQVVDSTTMGRGPTAGLAAAHQAFPTSRILLVAGDMPTIEPAVVRMILERARNAPGSVLCTSPVIRGFVEPLLSVYAPGFATTLMQCLAANETSLSRIISSLHSNDVRHVLQDELETVDPTFRTFRNINSSDDLASFR